MNLHFSNQEEPEKRTGIFAGTFQCYCGNNMRLIYPCCVIVCPICCSAYDGIWISNKGKNRHHLQKVKLLKNKFYS